MSSTQATIDALQAAFKARGADIGVYPGVVDGAALHQLVMAENGGVGPTHDEVFNANVNVSEWVLMNFEFDDMTGYIDTPEKQAAVDQFKQDLAVYGAREYMKGRVVHAVLPIVSASRSGSSGTSTRRVLLMSADIRPRHEHCTGRSILHRVVERYRS